MQEILFKFNRNISNGLLDDIRNLFYVSFQPESQEKSPTSKIKPITHFSPLLVDAQAALLR